MMKYGFFSYFNEKRITSFLQVHYSMLSIKKLTEPHKLRQMIKAMIKLVTRFQLCNCSCAFLF